MSAMSLRACLILLLSLLFAACGGGGGGSSAGAKSNVGAACTTTFMGSRTLMVGAQMADATAAAAPFAARYLYLAGGIAPAATTCMSDCNAAPNCGNWWGCWQEFTAPPGLYATRHIQRSTAASPAQVPMFTYYEILHSTGAAEGAAEVAAINDVAFLTRYFDDWRFLLQKIGNTRAMLHIEPDFWGYVRNANANPHLLPAPVQGANPADCNTQENSVAGFSRCMIAMVRKYAPNATVGLHASPWLQPFDANDGQALGSFMLALGAADSDFIATDPSDRDAGFYEHVLGQDRWWDDAKATAYLAWSRQLADTAGKPTAMWQIPLGNMAQNNTTNHWQDNRVDWLFGHLAEVAASRIVALLFGAGEGQQTTPESDGGNLVAKTGANAQAGGTSLCP
jgi:hypothetical protein